jgi:hypothetical protein
MFTQSKITLSADKYLGRGIMWHLEAALDLSTPSNSPRLVQFIWEEKLAVTLDASLIDIKFPVDYCTANNYRTHLESRKLNPNRWRNTRKKRARATSLHPREKMTIANQHGRVQSNLDSAIELMWRAPEVLNYQENCLRQDWMGCCGVFQATGGGWSLQLSLFSRSFRIGCSKMEYTLCR